MTDQRWLNGTFVKFVNLGCTGTFLWGSVGHVPLHPVYQNNYVTVVLVLHFSECRAIGKENVRNMETVMRL